jgi:hypothetical protein
LICHAAGSRSAFRAHTGKSVVVAQESVPEDRARSVEVTLERDPVHWRAGLPIDDAAI